MGALYVLRRRTLRNELKDQQDLVIEMELFHGTGKTPPNEIYDGEYGFDMTFCTSCENGIAFRDQNFDPYHMHSIS